MEKREGPESQESNLEVYERVLKDLEDLYVMQLETVIRKAEELIKDPSRQ